MILKNCLRGYLLCHQLSWQNFSFYFVLNLDTGPVGLLSSFQVVFLSWQGLQSGCQLLSSQNNFWSPRCGTIWSTTVACVNLPCFSHSTHNEWLCKLPNTSLLSTTVVSTLTSAVPVALVQGLVPVTVRATTIRHQCRASRMLARYAWSVWHTNTPS